MIQRIPIGSLKGFLGQKLTSLLLLGALAGVSIFVIEVCFAYGLQAFLLVLGVANEDSISLPAWVPHDSLGAVLWYLLATGVARAFFQWIFIYLQGIAPAHFLYEQRSRLYRWALHSKSVSGSQLNILFNERTSMAGTAIMFMQSAAVQATTAGLLGLTLLFLAPKITLIVGVLLFFLAVPIKKVTRIVRTAGDGIGIEGLKLNERLILSIKNLLLLRIYGMQHREEQQAQANLGTYLSHYLQYSRSNAALAVVPQLFGVLLICLIAMIGRSNTDLAPGVLVSYFYLFTRFMQNVSATTNTVSSIVFHWPQLKELFEWWRRHAESGGIGGTEVLPKRSEAGLAGRTPIGWSLRSLSFKFPESSSWIFRDLDLEISAGATTVIIGPSGCGKSTLLNLILGELSPVSGEILLRSDGAARVLKEADTVFLSQVGYVGAESLMIEGTIYDNLTFGLSWKPGAPEIDEAISKAECQFIHDLPAGLQHFITEQGQGLSAGQKQRLSLARALLRKPKALILDEATSNLDPQTEERLVATLAALKSEFTIVAVTHRKELLRIADQTLDLGRTLT